MTLIIKTKACLIIVNIVKTLKKSDTNDLPIITECFKIPVVEQKPGTGIFSYVNIQNGDGNVFANEF